MSLPTIPEFYRNKTIFITGGSGFIGKVLIEKLLRSCPEINTIYVLMREKRGKSGEDRIKTITDQPFFDLLKTQNSEALKKIKVISGDVMELGLGISPENRNILANEVNVVFHVAASVRFDDSLTDAILMNTRGTREVVRLALEMKSLDVLVHVSTTYCNSDRKLVDEMLYPPHADWEKTIEIAENVDRHTLNVLTEKYIHPLPNTYTFTKQLAEHVVHDLCAGKIPVVIYRPSIIISTAVEPVPGWIDNFNGPIGLLVAAGKGVIRTVYCNPDVMSDYIPVDITIKAMIIASWKQATYKDKTQKQTPSFYNGSNYGRQNITVKQMVELGKKITDEIPMSGVLWYPNTTVTKCYYNYFMQIIFYHFIPALFIDGLLKVLGKKPMLLKIQRRVYVANMAISPFSLNQWDFVNTKCYNLKHDLLDRDLDSFAYRDEELGVYEFFKNGTLGARKYLLKETEDLEKAKIHSNRMRVLAQIYSFLWYVVLAWLVFMKIDIIAILMHKWNDMIEYFATE